MRAVNTCKFHAPTAIPPIGPVIRPDVALPFLNIHFDEASIDPSGRGRS
jgi:hypothetical protein